jgi:hypothetical protein
MKTSNKLRENYLYQTVHFNLSFQDEVREKGKLILKRRKKRKVQLRFG